MTRNTANSEIGERNDDHERVVGALRMLFELLEDYSPRWYKQEHHDIASDALAHAKKRRSPSSVRHRLKDAA